MAELKNPMRFSIRNRQIDMEHWLRNDDVDEPDRQVTRLEINPGTGDVYVYHEER